VHEDGCADYKDVSAAAAMQAVAASSAATCLYSHTVPLL